MRVEPIRFWTGTKSNFLNRFVALASRLELLDLEIFENLQFYRVDSVSKGIDSKPMYTFLTELELQVESIREVLESIQTFLNFENKESERRYKAIHFLGYLNSFHKIRTVSLGLEGPAGLTTRLMAIADHRE
ncbi:hypothetical protein PIB30_056124 [Stylosanthes scabra]|uniref:Uncharacterized protein n=1 Tax=Stylosanthes scabra TaxID=79078 RepID=A0ABU6QJ00_9FABA|nr:hypothetical protein [Stylosanthes scabra]